jgi:hypothetical protein
VARNIEVLELRLLGKLYGKRIAQKEGGKDAAEKPRPATISWAVAVECPKYEDEGGEA